MKKKLIITGIILAVCVAAVFVLKPDESDKMTLKLSGVTMEFESSYELVKDGDVITITDGGETATIEMKPLEDYVEQIENSPEVEIGGGAYLENGTAKIQPLVEAKSDVAIYVKASSPEFLEKVLDNVNWRNSKVK